MRKILVCCAAVCLVSVFAFAQAPARQSQPPGTASPTADDVLKTMRADMQGSRADIMAKNLTLTAEQAAKFWPVFEQYQKEQNVIMDAQLKDVQKYVNSYQTLDDATALGLINAHIERDGKMNALRQKWLGEFQKVVPARVAARAMQIDRRLSLVAQLELVSSIPLIH
jgi:Spy/CpxP family protein refolding chaperone